MPKVGGDPIERDVRLNDDTILLRYMPYPKLRWLLSGRLGFTRADILAREDHFEGEYAESFYLVSKLLTVHHLNGNSSACHDLLKDDCEQIRKQSYVSCWTLGSSENMALWRIYGGGNNGVAVRTNVNLLEMVLHAGISSEQSVKYLRKRMVLVDYFDHRGKDSELSRQQNKAKGAKILFLKNIGYEYEKEVRIVLDAAELGYGGVSKIGEHCLVPVTPAFITEIVVSPLADDWFFDLVKHESAEFGLGDAVNWSSLKFRPGKAF